MFGLLCKGDSLTPNDLRQKFSTRDQDNDAWSSGSCAVNHKGGWWYGFGCYYSNLNGHYYHTGRYTSSYNDGVVWSSWKSSYYSMRVTEMKFKSFH